MVLCNIKSSAKDGKRNKTTSTIAETGKELLMSSTPTQAGDNGPGSQGLHLAGAKAMECLSMPAS